MFQSTWLIDWLAIGFETLRSGCTQALINVPFVPPINLWEPCCFAKVPDGPQTYTLDVLWLQEGAQIHMSERSQSFTFTKNVGQGFIHCFKPPTQWTETPIRWRFLLNVLCPVRRPITALDWVLLKDRYLALAPKQGPGINPRAYLWVLQRSVYLTIIRDQFNTSWIF